MGLTDIGDQKTPATPIEITLDPETGLPSADQEMILIGHADAGAPASALYTPTTVNNVTDADAAETELEAKGFADTSEIVKMVRAAITANAGGANFPAIKICALASTDTDFGSADKGLVNIQKTKAEFIVSPYDATSATLRGKLKTHVQLVSGATRGENYQYGSVGVAFNRSVSDPANLDLIDDQSIWPIWMPDSGSPTYSIGEMAAACAAIAAAKVAPFNPLDNVVIGSVTAPAKQTEWVSVGGGAQSETALQLGWTPLRVKANGDVAFVRTVTGRVNNSAGAPAGAYYDLQDWQVLYYWRKTVWTRLNQPDFRNVKASAEVAKQVKAELIRLAQQFQDDNMFQAVDKLAPSFKVERSASDRHRFDVVTPVNVIPGLHVIAVNIRAGVLFDSFTV